MDDDELRSRVKALLASQLYGVLATQGEGGAPHASIIAYASADSLGGIIFATPRATRKNAYMAARPGVAFFVDDRRPCAGDLMEATGVEASGKASELAGDERRKYRDLYLSRHPGMAAFVDEPGTALIRVSVDRYDVVDHFGRMSVLTMDSGTAG